MFKGLKSKGKSTLLVVATTSVALVAMSTPAYANIGPNAWDHSTIYVQTIKAGNSLEATWSHERLSYYRNVAGSTLNIIEGNCVVGKPCIHVYWDFYGHLSWDGLTTEADTNCVSTHAWCNYDGTPGTWTTVQFDRTYVDAYGYATLQSLSCHEWGRSLAELTAASGATCMNSATYQYTGLLSTEATSVRTKYTGVPR